MISVHLETCRKTQNTRQILVTFVIFRRENIIVTAQTLYQKRLYPFLSAYQLEDSLKNESIIICSHVNLKIIRQLCQTMVYKNTECQFCNVLRNFLLYDRPHLNV